MEPGTASFLLSVPLNTAKINSMTVPTSPRLIADNRNTTASQQSRGPQRPDQDDDVVVSIPRLRSGDREPQVNAGPVPMPAAHQQLLNALHGQIDAISLPYAGRVGALVAVFQTLKDGETGIWHSLLHHPDHAAVTRCKASLHRMLGQFAAALQASSGAGITGQASLDLAQIQTICQGLAVCVPSSGSLLVRGDDDSCDALQGLTHGLLSQAMTLGLVDVARANGELLDVLNWLSRGLKADLLTADILLKQCFEHSIVPILDWTSGNQSGGVLTDHNLGRCAVQISTILRFTGIDFAAPYRPGVADAFETDRQSLKTALTNGQQLQRCVLQLCAPAVLNRFAHASADTIALLNISNLVKYAIEKHLIAAHDPLLVPPLARLVEIVGTLPDKALVGSRADCRPLANFSNLLRLVHEQNALGQGAIADPFPGLDRACARLVECITSVAFENSYPGSQALSNLISFVKLCDKKLAHHLAALSAVTTTAAATTTSSSTVPPLGQEVLRDAAACLIDGVLWYGPQWYSGAPALTGLLAGLVYLCRRNLVAITPELSALIKGLLSRVGKIHAGAWKPQDSKTMLLVLEGFLNLDMVTVDDAQAALSRLLPARGNGAANMTLRDVVDEIARLRIVDEVVIPLPLPIQLPAAAPSSTISTRARPSNPPGWNPVSEKPAASSTPTTSVSSTRNKSAAHGNTGIKAVGPTWREVESRKRYASSSSAATPSSSSQRLNVAASGSDAQDFDTSPDSGLQNPESSGKPTGTPTEKAAAARSINTNKTASDAGKKKKSRQAPKKNKPVKSDARAGAHAEKEWQAKLIKAILPGKAKDVTQLFRQQPRWMEMDMHGMLDDVIKEIELLDAPVLSALDALFTVVKETGGDAGADLLTNYFILRGHVFSGLKVLADHHGLFTDPAPISGRAASNRVATQANGVTRIVDSARDYINDDLTRLVSFTDLQEAEGNDDAQITEFQINPNHAEFQDQTVRIVVNVNGVSTTREIEPDYAANLTYAAQEGDISRVRRLLTVQSPAVHVVAGYTPLILAIRRQHIDIVQLLLRSEPVLEQVTAKDKEGWNALMWAADVGSEKAVELLLAAGEASTQRTDVDKDGWNALLFAARKGHVNILRRLLKGDRHAKQLDATIPGGPNAMMIAAENGQEAFVSALVATSTGEAQLAYADHLKNNAMLMAVYDDEAKTLKLLLATRTAREQASAMQFENMNALTLAAALGRTALVPLFLETAFANELASPVIAQRANALMMAAQNGHTDVVRRLLQLKSADRQCVDVTSDRRNALILAAGNGREDIVRLLLSRHNAHQQAAVVDLTGLTALDYARKSKVPAIIQLLENVTVPATPEARPATDSGMREKVDH